MEYEKLAKKMQGKGTKGRQRLRREDCVKRHLKMGKERGTTEKKIGGIVNIQ